MYTSYLHLFHITPSLAVQFFFFFNDTATTEIYTLSLHDALPIFALKSDPSGSAGGSARPSAGAWAATADTRSSIAAQVTATPALKLSLHSACRSCATPSSVSANVSASRYSRTWVQGRCADEAGRRSRRSRGGRRAARRGLPRGTPRRTCPPSSCVLPKSRAP